MKRLICLLLVSLSLAGCLDEVEVLSEKRYTMQVVDVTLRSKRNSTADLKVVENGFVYRGQKLRCTKTEASNITLGSKWDVVVQELKQGDRYGAKLLGVGAICDLSQRISYETR